MLGSRHDVAIVGCGPVGLLLALQLGRAGHDVVVVDRHEQPYPLPRAVVCDHEARRIYQGVGLADEIAAISSPVPDWYEWRNQHEETLVRIKWWGEGSSGWPEMSFYSQPAVEAVLEDAVTASPNVTLLRGLEAVALTTTPDEAMLTLTSRAQDPTTLRARYLVGADGANSVVRDHVGTEVTDLGFFYDWLILDVIEHEPRTWNPMNRQMCDPARPHTMVAGGVGRRRWEFMRLPHETVEELNTADAAWRLLAQWDLTPDNATLERHAVYTFQARWAERWRRGRLMIAGDAAHLMPPFAGQGLCSGLRDATNLAWKLDLVLRGCAGDALLDTYGSERRAHVQHAIHTSVEMGRVICVTDPDAAAERDRDMIAGGGDPEHVLPAVPAPVLGPGVVSTDPAPANATAGMSFPQFEVAHAGRRGRFDDVVGGGVVVMTLGDPAPALSERRRRFLASVCAHLVRIVPPEADGADDPDSRRVTDVTAGYTARLKDIDAEAVVVRPDFSLFGARAEVAELGGMLDELAAAMHWIDPITKGA